MGKVGKVIVVVGKDTTVVGISKLPSMLNAPQPTQERGLLWRLNGELDFVNFAKEPFTVGSFSEL